MQKKATHITVSRSCGIIHGYARIRNPRLPRFLFGGGCKGNEKNRLFVFEQIFSNRLAGIAGY